MHLRRYPRWHWRAMVKAGVSPLPQPQFEGAGVNVAHAMMVAEVNKARATIAAMKVTGRLDSGKAGGVK